MAGEIYEWYGYRSADRSPEAFTAALEKSCPFVGGRCTKQGGVCSVKLHASQEITPVCPKRLYFEHFKVLKTIANEAFRKFELVRELDGSPTLIAGSALRHQKSTRPGMYRVAVFGQGWGAEIKLPPAVIGGSRYSVDFTLVVVDDQSNLCEFVPVEVQTIDTTDSYKISLAALRDDREIVPSRVGLNWENVNKRILPQLIVKGLMLQAEEKCSKGMYFVTPESVFKRILARLGGESRLRKLPNQPGSITFFRYQHDIGAASPQGYVVPMRKEMSLTISTSDMSLAFISPQNLPPVGAYEAEIAQKIGVAAREERLAIDFPNGTPENL
ncbi:NotI family restriction endonuclease [Rhodococcus sp. ANT_H53B]|uniref:NotI family restriction endonuclease n=1 Tax=Rhodococcus sp. ANT_H53B TaxID=2597357 RepID=UPI00165E4D79|nr:NotI family restriction endonuclease [Rhodococcus sp. ANT_H53B]